MHIINLKVNGNGTVENYQNGILHIATKGSKNCVKLMVTLSLLLICQIIQFN